MSIRDFIPPIIFKLNQKKAIEETSPEYYTYEEALEHCSFHGYQNRMLCDIIADKTAIYLKKLGERPFSFASTLVFLQSALYYYLQNLSKTITTIHVLDFGGACGAHYFEIRRAFPEIISFKWWVVETEQMVKSAIEKGLGNDELTFISSLDEIKSDIDMVHSSGAIQYVSKPYQTLDDILRIGAKALIFNRMMFNENNRDIITIQHSNLAANGPGSLPYGYEDAPISYPHTTLSLSQFNSKLLKEYSAEWEMPDNSGSYPINEEKIIGKSMLFVKKIK